MAITYTVGSALYVNMTNRCPNACDFCLRQNKKGVGDADSLWLEQEPSLEEVLASVLARDFSLYTELVFCGFGEPFCRIDDLVKIAAEVKKRSDIPIRIDTSGLGDLIAKRPTAPLLKGVIDRLSISLNAPSAAEYDAVCHSEFGESAFDAMLDFAKGASEFVPDTVFTVVDTISEDQIERCRQVAESAGIPLRIRKYIE